jgi:phage terminase large subunit-like protein
MFAPARYTPPLTDDFKAGIDPFLPAIELAWSVANNGFKFDDWQIELLRRMTELLPDGELRFRQVVASLGRQNGKSEVIGALGLYAVIRQANQFNVGVASTAEQARIIFDRLHRVISANPALERRMSRLTETRGIKTLDGSRYEIKAANANTLQGIPVSVGIIDEVHLVEERVWDALLSGTGSRKSSLLAGITTAGDENSSLLNRLYKNADKAIAGELDGFGAWIWEASEAIVPDDDDELMGLLMEANPALHSGRIDKVTLLQDVRSLPKDDIIRYRLNRFIQSGTKTFIPAELWQKCERPFGEAMPQGDFVFAIDRTPDWAHATVAVAVKVDDVIYTELVASINKPSLEQLIFICGQLMSHNPRAIIVDGYTLRDLHKELRARGYPAETATLGDIVNASSLFYARLARKTMQHGGDPLLSIQIPRTVRKMVGEGFRVSRRDSAVEIDAVMATLLATFGADTLREQPLQVF